MRVQDGGFDHSTRPSSRRRVGKAHRTSTAHSQANPVIVSCPRQQLIQGRTPLQNHQFSEYSIIHLTTRASNPLICPQSAPPYPIQSPGSSLKYNHHKYGEVGTYPHLTRGPPLPAEPFVIAQIPWGALRDAEVMRTMEFTDTQMIMVLKARYLRCGALQEVRATDVVHMIYYYRENEHCRLAAPWPHKLREEWLLKVRIMDVLRAEYIT